MKHAYRLPLMFSLCFAALEGYADQDRHGYEIEEVIVTAHPLSSGGLAQPVEALRGEELDREIADTIGATVARKPGIHTTSFGPAVGRPVIHGLDGARVRVMEDHVDTMDVSVTSGDHAVSVDPFIANEIEILKGPATLLYGSGAIGGVIDVHTGRVPREAPDALTGKLDLRAADNGDAFRGAFRLDGGTDSFAWHIDGFARDADDVDIPGFVRSSRFRAALEEQEDEDHHDEEEEEEDEEDHGDEGEEVRGTLPNSDLEAKGGAAGFAFVGERGFIGVSVSRLESDYGLPGFAHGHGEEEGEHGDEDEDEDHEEGEEEDHEEEEGDHEDEEDDHGDEAEGSPVSELEQTRIDLEAGLDEPFPGFRSLNLRVGINDYEHAEVEPSGEVGTLFENEAWEARLELAHNPIGGWEGVIGAQFSDREYAATGEEAYSPPVKTDALGLFWMGQRDFERFQMEAGLRFDRTEHDPESGSNETFSGVSASLGAVIPLAEGWTGTLLGSYATRMPVSEELFSDGPHFATQSFEIGDPDLDEEKAFDLNATLKYSGERWSLSGTVYWSEFSDFIYQADTGIEDHGLPVRQFAQDDATFTGFEVEGSVVAMVWTDGQLALSAFADTVSAELDVSGNDNLPRIPPSRVGAGFELSYGPFNFALDYFRAFKQDDIAEYELATSGYDDLRAYMDWHFAVGATEISLFVEGRNLTDAEQRYHTSYIKEVAPQPGRTIEGGVRVLF
ncbi:MAG: TonB-dependent receptor [Gammaproteobacteria bacterium]|nr:TonB-dependent receptor [Gammaproteobacteria bacterium]